VGFEEIAHKRHAEIDDSLTYKTRSNVCEGKKRRGCSDVIGQQFVHITVLMTKAD
jgi:hypothetical protein